MPDDQPQQAAGEQAGGEVPQPVDVANVASVLSAIDPEFDEKKFKKAVIAHIEALLAKHSLEHYAFLLLFDDSDEITEWHSNRIYRAASGNASKKNILLLIHSKGGRIEPAYLISKTCQRRSKEKFIVGIPRKAKSAATLVALGAHEIHMGLMSELGPIDPQVGGFPALGMKNALAQLAELSCQYPGASAMLGDYLNKKLDLHLLGYFERISESAVQYAERLLPEKLLPKSMTPRQLADHFVNHYKDHGFVIDADEASKLLGGKIVKQETKEYMLVNDVYESLDVVRRFMRIIADRDFDYCGSIVGGINIRKLEKKE